MKRLQWIDSAKGILILFVVLGHVVTAYQSAGYYTDNIIYNVVVRFAYSFHMAAFFFLSGYLYTYSKKPGVKHPIIKRLISYGIPYIIFTIVYIAVKVVLSSFASNPITMDEILWFWIKPLGYLWFLYALMLMEIIQDAFDGKIKPIVHVAIVAVIFFMNRYIGQWLSAFGYSDTVISKMFGYYTYFTIGKYYGSKIVERLSKLRFKWQTAIGLFALVVVGKEVATLLSVSEFAPVRLILAGGGITATILMGMALEKSRLFVALGNATFPIYLLHDYPIVAARIVLVSLISDTFSVPLLIIGTIVGCLLPWIALWVSRKILHLDFVFFPGKYIKIK